mmetsp:Transcript_29158/g.72698  ORF Transcript_29158/g.72698 Transcript_29158/m.72698 type:complete len:204 (-) Transcript_29158:283-894(-)
MFALLGLEGEDAPCDSGITTAVMSSSGPVFRSANFTIFSAALHGLAPLCTLLATCSGLIASHTPSEAKTRTPPHVGSYCVTTVEGTAETDGHGASPMQRQTANPPGHARSGPRGPFSSAHCATFPPTLSTRSRSSGESLSRCSAVRILGESRSSSMAAESPALAMVISCLFSLTMATVSVHPAEPDAARASLCSRSNATAHAF